MTTEKEAVLEKRRKAACLPCIRFHLASSPAPQTDWGTGLWFISAILLYSSSQIPLYLTRLPPPYVSEPHEIIPAESLSNTTDHSTVFDFPNLQLSLT